jgi:hypothetical protein
MAAAALVIGGVVIGRRGSPSPPTTAVGCFASDTTDATPVPAVMTSIEATGSAADQTAAAIRVCSAEWSKGRVVGPPADASGAPTPPSYRIPDMTVCRMPDGSLGVFPGASITCAGLGPP